jgi:hypothetical protein
MSLTETIAKELIQSMSKEERQHFVDLLLEDFLVIMSPLEKKDMMRRVLPQIIDGTMKDMTIQEKEQMVDEVVSLMRSNLGRSEKEHAPHHPTDKTAGNH